MKDIDKWVGMKVADLKLPSGMVMAVIKRKDKVLIPRGDVVIQGDDTIVIGAEPFEDEENIVLKELMIQDEHPWCGQKLKDLDISRHSVVVLVKRKNKALIPYGNMVIEDNDRIFMYTQKYLAEAKEIDI